LNPAAAAAIVESPRLANLPHGDSKAKLLSPVLEAVVFGEGSDAEASCAVKAFNSFVLMNQVLASIRFVSLHFYFNFACNFLWC
jgi:hypothetical protein